MSNYIGNEMLKFIDMARTNKEITRAYAKQVSLNIMATRDIPLEDRTEIAIHLLKEWTKDKATAAGLLSEFASEIQELQWALATVEGM